LVNRTLTGAADAQFQADDVRRYGGFGGGGGLRRRSPRPEIPDFPGGAAQALCHAGRRQPGRGYSPPGRHDAGRAARLCRLGLCRSPGQCPLDGGGAQWRCLPAEPTKEAGKITLLRDTNGDGKADKTFTFASSGFQYPHGLAFHEGYLYVGDLQAIWRIPYKDGQTVAGKPEKVTTKVEDLRPRGGHVTRDIAFGPDGALYLAMGSRDNISDFKPGAQIFKVNADGSMAEFASGIRNPVGIAFAPGTNTLYVTANERDGLGDDLPPDYLTSVRQGGFYGYPYAYIGRNPDPVWGAKDPAKVAATITPDVLFHAHSAPTGLVFYTGAMFPAEYKGDAFVALHGSWNAAGPTGYKVVRVHFSGGRPENGYENFATGFWNGMGAPGAPAKVWGRPVGLAVAKDGALLIADDTANVVWRVAYTGK